jgi:predicted phage terminase large subunit-like protein
MSGVKPYIRATMNPDADSWVRDWIRPWIDNSTGYPIPEMSGVVRWYTYENNVLEFYEHPVAGAKTITFIPSNIYDNKKLIEKDPDYLNNLRSLDHVERMRLLEGNWNIRAEGGKIFNREYIGLVDPIKVPNSGIACRYWDLASTEKSHKDRDPDWTCGGLMKRVGDVFYMTDMARFRENPGVTDNMIIEQTRIDRELALLTKTYYFVGMEVEPGASGKREFARMVQLLHDNVSAGLTVIGKKPSGDKVTEAKPFASFVTTRNFYAVRAPWTTEYVNELHNFPLATHDDQVDVSKGGYRAIVEFQSAYSQLQSARSYSYR